MDTLTLFKNKMQKQSNLLKFSLQIIFLGIVFMIYSPSVQIDNLNPIRTDTRSETREIYARVVVIIIIDLL